MGANTLTGKTQWGKAIRGQNTLSGKKHNGARTHTAAGVTRITKGKTQRGGRGRGTPGWHKTNGKRVT